MKTYRIELDEDRISFVPACECELEDNTYLHRCSGNPAVTVGKDVLSEEVWTYLNNELNQ